MQLLHSALIDVDSLEDAVRDDYFERGARLARQHPVTRMRWDPADFALHGTVVGDTDVYETSVYFVPDDEPPLEFDQGQCTCPVGFNCKHVVALALSAAGGGAAPAPRSPKPRPVTWDQSLRSLLDSAPTGGPDRSGGTPLAIELSQNGSTVLARMVRPGRNGWYSAGPPWARLVHSYYTQDFVAAHVRLLRELFAVYQSGKDDSGRYSYRDEKTIDLAAFESRQLWTLLDEADEIGVRVVHSRKRLGDVPRHASAELCVDVTGGGPDGLLVISPVLRLGGSDLDAAPFRFVGADGHGVVFVNRAELRDGSGPDEWHLQLAKLERPVPAQLQQLAMENRCLSVPAAELARFGAEFYPRLRHLAPVISSDGSFEPPEISAPTLVLNADYGTGHDLELSWEWAYQVGDTRMPAPLHPEPGQGYRDLDAERAILAGLDIPSDVFGSSRFGGIDTMRFSTEMLPLLRDRPGVEVEIGGEPANYREAGDSLRISVSTEDIAGETDWFDLGVSISVEDREVPFLDVFLALSRDQSHLLLADGAYFSLQKPELQALRRLIEEARALQDSPGSLKISRFQFGLWDELAELGVVGRQAKAWQRQLEGLRSVNSIEANPPPETLDAELPPYQLDGFRWLAFLWEFQLGGILADDMGLGKTLQSLALISHAKNADPGLPPFLVVAPTSVVSNWVAESARFAPDLKVVAVTDTMRRRGQEIDEVVGNADVVVTSYTLLRLDFDAYSAVSWSGLIMDEAQFAKNHQSKIHQCARKLAAPVKLAITGTPMENNLMELWSLLSITAPGLFPSPTRFQDYYARPIEKRGDTELLAQLRRRVKPLMRRRTKEQVAADLPEKQEQVLEVELHPKHRKLYQTYLQRERQKVLGLIDDVNRNRFTILSSLTLLRQLSLHAGLVDDKHRELPCAKLDALLEQLHDVIAGGHRALVFSQFTGFLGQVRERLDTAGVAYCYLDGQTRKRAELLRRFKDGSDPVFLISLKAGGFGLNLTEADYCFLLDPWWNPATEAQAVDRTHRIGQTRNVMVYRLIAKDTIEEKVMALKARKAELFASVMDEGNAFGSSLDAEDIRGLFA
ncbi:MAG TPA: DEAD/DEAH box helicase [Actinophytocola sp.]|jgi:superfamily II DNA or RNA helicase|uniref:DEAD/DEAH box helicase n=1 Tax=Actinophytocola sp. TaxID=1872138 RepID=UPI002E0AF8FC|nr:DEAD/DEAH box helicase [Actinophytocola sp.]